uniref:C-type cytochrome n=1 Tax=Roseihalotalea indica TaxID=2867963 RepID=A0AA49GNA8_9BACT|nr:c-type cytochrome [Tunicatimonas sp. TK19036]
MRTTSYPALGFLSLSMFFSCQSDSPPFSQDAQEALSTFEVADGFTIELVASEPLVADPVAMEIDEFGRMYVAEMHGYPLDTKGSGKIKLLSDTDQDGMPDQSSIFAEGLILPTGIMRWKEGIIVTDAPNVWYLEDTTGDGTADIKEAMLTGFARSNPQHNLNSPVYGLDNWIYLAHESTVSTKFFHDQFGGEGQPISFPGHQMANLPVNADGRNVRFRPDSYELEIMSGETQFGHTFDTWGHQLLTSNAEHLFHEVLPARYLTRNANLGLPTAMQYIPAYGRGVEVYPITQNPEHQLLTDVGTITSACGVTWYQGGLFPEEYQQVTFVAEPVHNLIHADVIKDDGATFKAERLLEEKEFLASTDSWFRPVNFYVGPDGALYLLDYYRQIIEHPEWMSEEVNQSGALYNGTEKGRIYRIVPEGKKLDKFLDQLSVGKATNEELVKLLTHPNLWWRRTAQRLLVDRKAENIEALLVKTATDTSSPEGRVHALWTLQGLEQLDEETISAALKDSEAGVRENAVKLAELHLEKSPTLLSKLISLEEDPAPKVRFQLLCTLSGSDKPEAQSVCEAILQQDIADEWVQYAALSTSKPESVWLQFAQEHLTVSQNEASAAFMKKLGNQVGRTGNSSAIHDMIQLTATATSSDSWWRAAFLDGLAQGVHTSPNPGSQLQADKQLLIKNITPNRPDDLRKASLHLLAALGDLPISAAQQTIKEAKAALSRSSSSVAWQQDALTFLGLVDATKYQDQFMATLTPQHPTVLQKEALKMLSNVQGVTPCNALIDRWPSLTPAVRDQAVDVFLEEPARMHLLLAAVENHQIDPSAVGWRRTVHLMNHDDDSIRIAARKVFTSSDSGSIDQYRPFLSDKGNYEAGKLVFERACATCHQLQGKQGTAFGPDLSSVRNRSKDAILKDVLFPNQSIADGYELWRAELSNGTTQTGIITSETPSSLTLTDLAGNKTTVDRNAINHLEALEYSAMPEGLANQITEEAMNDLLTFIKQP